MTIVPVASCIRGGDGTVIPLEIDRWSAPADATELRRLEPVVGPVIDIGCGPGRLVVALAERGIPALGVDASPVAVSQAQARRASALVRSVFDPLPGTGRWRTALLFDGNVGIGGDPVRLLSRVAELLASGGSALVECSPPGTGLCRFDARVEHGDHQSTEFPWALLGTDAVEGAATDAGLRLLAVDEDEDRWFATLERTGAR